MFRSYLTEPFLWFSSGAFIYVLYMWQPFVCEKTPSVTKLYNCLSCLDRISSVVSCAIRVFTGYFYSRSVYSKYLCNKEDKTIINRIKELTKSDSMCVCVCLCVSVSSGRRLTARLAYSGPSLTGGLDEEWLQGDGEWAGRRWRWGV